jgi:hypothetical protein
MGENLYKYVNLVESGSTMEDPAGNRGPAGNRVGNTCFFNCVQAGLSLHGSEHAARSFSDFLALGGWKRSFAGQMVDTDAHADNIERLAQSLGVKIHVYSEIIPGVTNSTIYSPFGSQGVVIRICRCYNFQHFKLMSFRDGQTMLDEQRRRAEEAEAHRFDALHAQAATDALYVKTLIEEEETRRLDALHAQAAADETLVQEMLAKHEAQLKQESEDEALVQEMLAKHEAQLKQESEDEALAKLLEQQFAV